MNGERESKEFMLSAFLDDNDDDDYIISDDDDDDDDYIHLVMVML